MRQLCCCVEITGDILLQEAYSNVGITSGYKYNILAGFPASLGFPPYLSPSIRPSFPPYLFPSLAPSLPACVIFFGVRIWLVKVLGQFSINYFLGLGLRIRVRVWVMV